jgi:hypothetical protein
MTQKEKSTELLERFHMCMYHHMGEGKMGYVNRAKQCAIICVEQIIEVLQKSDERLYEAEGVKLHEDIYWQEVLSHLKNS